MDELQKFTDAIQIAAEECASKGHTAPFVALVSLAHRDVLGDLLMVHVPAGQVDILFKQTLMPDHVVVTSWDIYFDSDLNKLL